MTKIKKTYQNLSHAELITEAEKLKLQIAKSQIEMVAGKLKNTRAIFNLRKQLAIVQSYANNHR